LGFRFCEPASTTAPRGPVKKALARTGGADAGSLRAAFSLAVTLTGSLGFFVFLSIPMSRVGKDGIEFKGALRRPCVVTTGNPARPDPLSCATLRDRAYFPSSSLSPASLLVHYPTSSARLA